MNGSTETVDYRQSVLRASATPATVFDVQSAVPLVSVEHKYFNTRPAADAYADCVRAGNRHVVVTVRPL